jgi:hypothetical protein
LRPTRSPGIGPAAPAGDNGSVVLTLVLVLVLAPASGGVGVAAPVRCRYDADGGLTFDQAVAAECG